MLRRSFSGFRRFFFRLLEHEAYLWVNCLSRYECHCMGCPKYNMYPPSAPVWIEASAGVAVKLQLLGRFPASLYFGSWPAFRDRIIVPSSESSENIRDQDTQAYIRITQGELRRRTLCCSLYCAASYGRTVSECWIGAVVDGNPPPPPTELFKYHAGNYVQWLGKTTKTVQKLESSDRGLILSPPETKVCLERNLDYAVCSLP
jgi:hypothetical protein